MLALLGNESDIVAFTMMVAEVLVALSQVVEAFGLAKAVSIPEGREGANNDGSRDVIVTQSTTVPVLEVAMVARTDRLVSVAISIVDGVRLCDDSIDLSNSKLASVLAEVERRNVVEDELSNMERFGRPSVKGTRTRIDAARSLNLAMVNLLEQENRNPDCWVAQERLHTLSQLRHLVTPMYEMRGTVCLTPSSWATVDQQNLSLMSLP